MTTSELAWAQGYFPINDLGRPYVMEAFRVADAESTWATPIIYECEACGALVRETRRHVDWHKKNEYDIALAAQGLR